MLSERNRQGKREARTLILKSCFSSLEKFTSKGKKNHVSKRV